MAQYTKAILRTARRMDMAQRNGPMVQFTWANLRTVCGMDKVR